MKRVFGAVLLVVLVLGSVIYTLEIVEALPPNDLGFQNRIDVLNKYLHVLFPQQTWTMGSIILNGLSGSYTGGSAYLCVWNNGTVYANETGC